MGGTMRWAELRMCRFWAGGISSFPFSRAREYRLLRRLLGELHRFLKTNLYLLGNVCPPHATCCS